ncbi:class I lanthipeptide [Dyadobacter flavalbus]|nr:class I lanthipeptide [Dyadobacter flavalbus]
MRKKTTYPTKLNLNKFTVARLNEVCATNHAHLTDSDTASSVVCIVLTL